MPLFTVCPLESVKSDRMIQGDHLLEQWLRSDFNINKWAMFRAGDGLGGNLMPRRTIQVPKEIEASRGLKYQLFETSES